VADRASYQALLQKKEAEAEQKIAPKYQRVAGLIRKYFLL